MALYTLSRISSAICQNTRNQSRSFFYWLTVAFNNVDEERVKMAGPDLACAMWLLRNGAEIRWKGIPETVTNYDIIQFGKGFNIEVVHAVNAGICDVGFPYFKGCNYIKELSLEECKYIENNAMRLLSILKDSLTDLQIIKCIRVDEDGLRHLKALKNLRTLKVQGLPAITDPNGIKKELSEALPKCKIEID